MLCGAFAIIFSFKKDVITLAEKWPAIVLKNYEAPTIPHDKLL